MTSLHHLLQEFLGHCTRCHYLGSPNTDDGHDTVGCPSDIIGPTSQFRAVFRSSITFPLGLACYLCAVPFAPPFNHPFHQPYPTPIDPNNCHYPDCLKVIAYLVYNTPADRSLVFGRLGIPTTMSMMDYSTWLGQVQPGGILNVYELLVEYRSLRLAGRL